MNVMSHMKVKGQAFKGRPFRSKLVSVGKPSLPLHNGLVDYFYVTSSGSIVFLKAQRYMYWFVWYDNYLYDRYYDSMCPYGCSEHCRQRYYYWYWSWKCYVCRRLCQRLALFATPSALARLISDPVCDSRFRSRSNMFPIHGAFFPMWTYNYVFQDDSSIDIYTLQENDAEVPQMLRAEYPGSSLPSVFRQTFVIRFSNVSHVVEKSSRTTFSVVLGTDYINTYAFVLLNECKKWKLVVPYYTFVYSGYFFPSENFKPPKIFQVPAWFYKNYFGLTIQNAHNFGSTALSKYVLGFSLSNNPSNYVNPSLKCYNWLQANNYTTPVECRTVRWGTWSWQRCYYPQWQARRWCPRSDSLISTMGMGFEPIDLPHLPSGVDCYQAIEPPDHYYQFRSVCCYRERSYYYWWWWWWRPSGKPFYWWGRFQSGPYAGVPIAFITREDLNTHAGRTKYFEQLEAYKWCCLVSRSKICYDFWRLYPRTYGSLIFRNGGWRGDPHLTTLDGTTYSFNGVGAFLLAHGKRSFGDLETPQSFNLVGLFQTSPNVTDATFTTGMAIQTNNNGSKSSIFEVSFNSDRSGLELWVDRSLVKNTVPLTTRSGKKFTGGRVRLNGTDYLITLNTGVTLKVHPLKGSLSMDLILDDDYKGNVTGLLGNNNGDPSDDIQSRDGTTTLNPKNSTDEQIFPVAKTWVVNCSDPDEAILHYNESGCRALRNDSFRPLFSTDDIFGGDAALRSTAIKTCGNNTACQFDVARTKDTDFGKATKESQETVERTSVEETNSAPKFANNETEIQVQVGRDGSVDVTATDDDKGDSVNVTLETSASWLRLNKTLLIWSNASDSSTEVNATVEATDSKGLSTSMDVKIQMCDCKANATCLWVENNKDEFVDVECNCTRGRSGRYCEIDEDGCVGNPCYVSCTDVPAEELGDEGKGAGYICAPCPKGLEGDGENCTDIDECETGTSGCNQTCSNTPGSFVCSCRPGFIKANKNCYDIDECAQNASRCGDHASCNNTEGSFLCSCNQGYQNVSNRCVDVDECSATPTICSSRANSVCHNTRGSYLCDCKAGFALNSAGVCEALDNCLPRNNCSQTCTSVGSSYTCSCKPGFSLGGDARTCSATAVCSTVQANDCVGGACALVSGSPKCACSPGLEPRTEGSRTICENINECADSSKKACRGAASCSDRTPGFSCSCQAGYNLVSGVACVDIDECALGSHTCNARNSRCVNTAGGFSCVCLNGYTRPAGNSDSKTCVDLDECAADSHNCDKNANCRNTVGSFECVCKTGFSGNGRQCEDIDECATLNDCDARYGVCENSVGSFICRCTSGFEKKNGSNECIDIDECKMGKAKTGCYNDTLCANSPGSYRCGCPDGTLLAADAKSCTPIVTCDSGNPCGTAECAVVEGEKTCICPPGTIFKNASCEDINECANKADVCPTKNKVKCVNIPRSYRCECLDPVTQVPVGDTECGDRNECLNSTLMRETCNRASSIPLCENKDPGYECYCSNGFFRPVNDTGMCEDIDECAIGMHKCEEGSTCSNLDGRGYKCLCRPGYKSVGTKCIDINECESSNGGCEHKCTNTEGSFACSCRSGFQLHGSFKCEDIDECTRGIADCEQNCVNTEGSYTCTCQEGFEKIAGATGELSKCRPRVACPAGHGCASLCAAIDGSPQCFCPNSGFSLADNCKDNDECKSSPCEGQSECKNVPGSFRCECKDGYSPRANGTGCVDRHGGWTAWTAWDSCSGRCGRKGERKRSRECTQPTPRGNGLLCLRTDTRRSNSSELVKETCGTELCEMTVEESHIAVYLEFTVSGLIDSDVYFNYVEAKLHDFIATEVTKYCNTNFKECCRNGESGSWRRLSNKLLHFVSVSDIFPGSDSPRITSNRLVISTLVRPLANANLCSNVVAARRRKRETATRITLPKSVLEAILKGANATQLAAVIEKALSDVHLPLSVQLAAIRSAISPTTTAAATTTSGPAVATKNDSWVIPVAVSLSVLAVIGLVILSIFLVKRSKQLEKLNTHRVDPLDEEEEDTDEGPDSTIPIELSPQPTPEPW